MTTALAKLDQNFAIPNVTKQLEWYDLASLPTEGQGWPGSQTPGRYGRLPAKAQGVVRDPVWQLGHASAGLATRFVTDSADIAASWDILGATLAMNHMPATGMSGLDLYVRSDGRWRWAGVTRPEGTEGKRTFTQMMIEDLKPQRREYLLYLPLYNSVGGVRIGLAPGSSFEPAPARQAPRDKPICFYGTSILQGGCASRPGMAYPAIISRKLDVPHINLGFSGNAQSEIEVAHLLAELDPSVYVLDPLPNMQRPMILERTQPLIQTLRKAHPRTPILMIENITYQQGHLHQGRFDRYTTSNQTWKDQYDQLLAHGVTDLHYLSGENLLGDDDEATVDGTHATDLGFMRMAQVIGPVLAEILGQGGKK